MGSMVRGNSVPYSCGWYCLGPCACTLSSFVSFIGILAFAILAFEPHAILAI
jgi:hypothetical protein